MNLSLDYNLQEIDNDDKVNNEDKVDLNTSISLKDKFDPKFQNDMNTILGMGYD